MVVFGLWIINKAGGLVFQRNINGQVLPHQGCRIELKSCQSTDGLAQLSQNEYLVMAGTLHGIHAITSRLSPVGNSSGAQVIEGESFKMTIFLTLTGS
jgi:trafficking protein particle complex subunit 4